MLDAETKRRIDTARDILVGKVPDPKSQVEQITIALIYKFMDDLDAESEELGGQRQFFADGFARYGWAKLIQPGLGGHETLNLYAEAITRMPENPGIPPLFRDIFNNAYLPYRDPETLRAFLKIINEFTYDHSERLGDAFEYLLSVLGSQGDAGQFRTPRHIIDFIVAVVDPKKDEVVLDPACGTAGFLISSYKHILAANTDDEGNSTLRPDESGRLAENFKGYDISPDMVRLSLVNMYLHGFVAPQINEYDTLTSDERWNEYADVILANPPFMSPKGGIRPHNRFSVKSKRSEVLFVDYMAEHLTPTGRAGIIVPEGIIFQSQKAHTALRKMLVEEYLVAVVSLPGGVFNPYSGVKTSILVLDKALARRTDQIAFFKVEADGYGLGAQRTPIDRNDLPEVQAVLSEFLARVRAGDLVDDFVTNTSLIVAKDKVSADGDYNLSGERYRVTRDYGRTFPLVSIGDTTLFRVESGGTPKSDVKAYWNGGVAWATLVDLPPDDLITEIRTTQRTISATGLQKSSATLLPEHSVVVSTRATIGRIGINRIPLATNQGFKNVVIEDRGKVLPEYVALAITKLVPTMDTWASGGTFKEISKSLFCQLQIPLPPLEIQREIVAEIEGYQRVIDGARAVVENYRPRIAVDPEWPMVALGDVCDILDKVRRPITKRDRVTGPYPYYGATGVLDHVADFLFDEPLVLVGEDGAKWASGEHTAYRITGKTWVNNHAHVIRPNRKRLLDLFLTTYLVQTDLSPFITGVTVPKLNQAKLRSIPLPLPSLIVQESIVAELEELQALVEASRRLVVRMEEKVQAAIGRVWGDEVPVLLGT